MNAINLKNWECHKKTIISFLISAIGSLLPTLLCLLVFKAVNHSSDTFYYLKNGEFYLYSTAILTQGAFILYEEKIKSYDMLSIFFWVSIIIIVVSAVLYLLTLIKTLEIGLYEIDKSFLINTSIWFLLFAFFILYFSSYIMNFKIDVGGSSRASINAIKDQLN